MTGIDIAVLAGAAVLTGGLWWFFFGRRRVRVAELRAGVQEIQITVKGGYSPDVIRARAGVPLRLVFDRREAGDCTSRVLFPDFAVSRALPAFTSTTVEFTPGQAGQFGFGVRHEHDPRHPPRRPAHRSAHNTALRRRR